MRRLLGRLGGRMRSIPGGHPLVFAGWDMTAALALAGALGLPAHLVAEMLPAIEAAAVEAAASDGDPAGGDDDV